MKAVRIPLLAAAAAAFVGTGAAAAQGGAVPGVDGRRLQTGVDSLTVYVVRGTDTVPTGFVRDEISNVTDAAGVALLQRVYTTRDRFLGSRVDSIFDRLETLSPVRQRSVDQAQATTSLDFARGRVTGKVRPVNGTNVDVDMQLRGTVYNAATFDLVLRAAPLRDGWHADLPAFIAATGTLADLHATVRGMETIGGRECWRVAASFAATPVTFWIDRETRQLRQMVMQIGADAQVLFRAPPPLSTPARSS